MTTLSKFVKTALLSITIVCIGPAMGAADTLQGSHIRKVDCDKGESVNEALGKARPGDTIQIQGICNERVSIEIDQISLKGIDGAIIDGSGVFPDTDVPTGIGVVEILGVRGVSLEHLTIQNGQRSGLLAKDGAAFASNNVTVKDNEEGIAITGNSGGELTDTTIQGNDGLGLVVSNNSTTVLRGGFSSADNESNGIALISRSVVELQGAAVLATGNGRNGVDIDDSTVTMFGFPGSEESSLIADNNEECGIFAASGDLETLGAPSSGSGTFLISAQNNGFCGIDLRFNGEIKSPAGATKFVIKGNDTGLFLGDGSAAVIIGGLDVQDNVTGLIADAAGTLTLVSIPPNPSSILNNGTDVNLAFGTRASIFGVTVGTVICDDTVLLRGTTGLACPIP